MNILKRLVKQRGIRARIVPDSCAGYAVQIWRWYLPIWFEADFANTHDSVERAEAFAHRFIKSRVKEVDL